MGVNAAQNTEDATCQEVNDDPAHIGVGNRGIHPLMFDPLVEANDREDYDRSGEIRYYDRNSGQSSE